MEVHIFDPTPRAIAHVSKVLEQNDPLLSFHPWGLWSSDDVLRFYAPQNSEHVSHSILNLQRTENFFEAPCFTIASLAKKLSHKHINLVKMDIEGAEYEALRSLLDSALRPELLLVEFDEFHHPLDGAAGGRIREAIERLLRSGYQLYYAKNGNYCFRLAR